MSINRRLARLECLNPPDAPKTTFVLVEPPAGMTREEHNAWVAQSQESGDRVFTLDLKAASAARLRGDDEF